MGLYIHSTSLHLNMLLYHGEQTNWTLIAVLIKSIVIVFPVNGSNDSRTYIILLPAVTIYYLDTYAIKLNNIPNT